MPWFRANHLKTAVLALIIANMIWGAAPPIFKWALQDIGPFTLAFLRFGLAALIILPFSIKHLKVERSDIFQVFLLGFFGVAFNISFFFLGLEFAPSINASIIASAGPIFLILFSSIFLHEKVKSKLIVGSLIGLIGVLIIMFEPIFTAQPNLNLLGNLFFFLALMGGLGHTLIGRSLTKKYEALGMTFWSFLIGTVCFLPLAYNEVANNAIPEFTTPAVVGILFGAVLSSAVAYFLFFWALKYMQAAETGVFVYIDPIVTVIIALPLLGEKPDAFYFIGAIFVFIGIYIAEGRIQYHPLHLFKHKD